MYLIQKTTLSIQRNHQNKHSGKSIVILIKNEFEIDGNEHYFDP